MAAAIIPQPAIPDKLTEAERYYLARAQERSRRKCLPFNRAKQARKVSKTLEYLNGEHKSERARP